MYRRLAAVALSASTAAICVFSLSANAAAKAPIRTFTEQFSLEFLGVGSQQGFYLKESGGDHVVISPRLALDGSTSTSYRFNGVVHNNSDRGVIVGNRQYAKKDGGRWVASTLSAKTLAIDTLEQNPYTSLARFGKLPGIHLVSPGHYSVTGPFAKISPFVRYEFELASDAFAGTGTKTLTVTMALDSGGRPVKITASGRSADNVFTVTETFSHYNKPVTITAP
jgi:hypothetical protein